MKYTGPIPSTRQLKKLAAWEGPFPMKSRHMIIGAERLGFDDGTIQFLRLFPHDEIFKSRDDFLCQCASLETTIRAGRLLKRSLSA